MLTSADADLLPSACDLAVTLTTAGFGMIAGAVYKPACVIAPQLEPVHPAPEMLHDTVVFELPVRCTENCWEADGRSFAEVGEIVILTPGTMVTVALADLDGSTTDVAVSDRNAGFGGTEGAVNRPEELTVPHVLPAQPIPVIVQVTAVFVEPVTEALNCCCTPTPT